MFLQQVSWHERRTHHLSQYAVLFRRCNKDTIQSSAVAQSCPMSSVFDQRPPKLLQVFYKQLARRYGAPGVRLANFPGRWMAFRTADLAAGVERAIMDVESTEIDLAQHLEEFESSAEFVAGEDDDAILVAIWLANNVWVGRDGESPKTTPALAITAWSLAHPVAVAGTIDLDEAGTPLRTNEPFSLLRARRQSAP
jgi:hypothetical protein